MKCANKLIQLRTRLINVNRLHMFIMWKTILQVPHLTVTKTVFTCNELYVLYILYVIHLHVGICGSPTFHM